jgi:hypothetical protein
MAFVIGAGIRKIGFKILNRRRLAIGKPMECLSKKEMIFF